MEIVRGLGKKRATKQLQAFLAGIPSQGVLVFDQAAAELAGRIEGELERIGRPIGRADPMIAAIALVNGLELVTGNTAHYQRIRQIGHPLTLRDWRTMGWRNRDFVPRVMERPRIAHLRSSKNSATTARAA